MPFFHNFMIVVAGLLAYSHTWCMPFQFDDIGNIVDKRHIQDLANYWPPSGSRWLGLLTFALNYRFGGLAVAGYHAVNLAIHISNALVCT